MLEPKHKQILSGINILCTLQPPWMMQKPRQIMTANGVASVRLWQTHPVDFPRGHIAPKWHNEAHWAQWRKMTIHDLSPRFSTGIESLTPPKLYRELKLFVDAFKKLDLWACICNLNVESIMIFTTGLAANNFWKHFDHLGSVSKCNALLCCCVQTSAKNEVPSWKLRFAIS